MLPIVESRGTNKISTRSHLDIYTQCKHLQIDKAIADDLLVRKPRRRYRRMDTCMCDNGYYITLVSRQNTRSQMFVPLNLDYELDPATKMKLAGDMCIPEASTSLESLASRSNHIRTTLVPVYMQIVPSGWTTASTRSCRLLAELGRIRPSNRTETLIYAWNLVPLW